MKKLQPFLEKYMTRDNMIILALFGVLLMVIAMPIDNKKESEIKEEESPGLKTSASETAQSQDPLNTLDAFGAEGVKLQDADAQGDEISAYESRLEKRLEELLSQMAGVGEVAVMVKLSASRETVVEKDGPSASQNVKEEDSAGGSRDTNTKEQDETTVFTKDNEGSETPYVRMVKEPVIEGVTVIAKGGGSVEVQQNITDAIVALFGIEPHKIKVAKMK